MTLFEFLEPNCIETAVSLLLEDPAGTMPISGGTDLLGRDKGWHQKPPSPGLPFGIEGALWR